MTAPYTPSQTPGPYFHLGLLHERFAGDGGIAVSGEVTDGAGVVADALLEFWYRVGDGACAVRRAATDTDGCYRIAVAKPPVVASDAVVHAPHVDVVVLAGGLQRHLLTRMYFPDEGAANTVDATLALVPAEHRDGLVARRADDGLFFDICLQGDGETVFFDV